MTNRAQIVLEQEGKIFRPFAHFDTLQQAQRVATEMNRLNQEAARLTGKTITFIYKVLVRS